MRKVGTSKAPKKLTSVRPKDFRIYEKILIKGFEYVYSSGKGMNNINLIVSSKKILETLFIEKGRYFS